MGWISIPIPESLSRGRSSQTIEYCDFGDGWAIYIIEVIREDSSRQELLRMMEEDKDPVRWSIIYKGKEMASGTLKSASLAKVISTRILESLTFGSGDPDTSSENIIN